MIKLEQDQDNQPPTDQVVKFRQQALADSEIIQKLQDQGYSYQQISEAINQAEIQEGVGGGIPNYSSQVEKSPLEYPDLPLDIPAPASQRAQTSQRGMRASSLPSEYSSGPAMSETSQEEEPQIELPQKEIEIPRATYSRGPEEQIEEIAESIINEKWQALLEDVGDLSAWKERITTDLSSVKQEILRVEHRFENLQKAVLGKVSEYDKGISSVSIELKALEKVFQRIISPLTSNIKELERITKELKKK